MTNKKHLLIMAGGTGGHIFPALAVAKEWISQGHRVSWLGTQKGLEARLIPEYDLPLHTIDISGMRKKGALSLALAPVRILKAYRQARAIIKDLNPDVVLGMGGFAAGPGGLAAHRLHIPLVIHEQNAAAGLTNRILSRWACQVLQAFPDTFDAKKVKAPVATLGNPVRRDILELAAPGKRFAERSGPIRLLVLGGSGGALAINKTVPAALALIEPTQRPTIRHQAGRTLAAAQDAYTQTGVQAQVSEFISDMAEAYAWADLVVCRSGALTVAELAASGLPALLIPYPYAVDNHQTANGRWLTETGGAQLIEQAQLSAQGLADTLKTLMASRSDLAQMANKIYARAWRSATIDITQRCLAASAQESSCL